MSPGLTARGVSVRLGGQRALDGASLAAAPGEMVGLVGPNGAGKTTLLRVLAGLQETEAGEVFLDGRTLAETGAKALARDLAYLPHGAPCHWPLPVERVVALGRLPHLGRFGRPAPEDAAVIETVLEQAEVTGFRARTVQTLSSGERARVMIARALAQEPKVLLADEPTVALDPYHQLRVLELLRGHARAGSAVVAVLHDLTLAARYCGRLVLLVAGRVAADGPPDEVLTAELLREAYGVEVIAGLASTQTFVLPAAEPMAGG